MEAKQRKIVQALNYFILHNEEKQLDKVKAYKLLWLADRYHVRQYGRTITNDTYFALPKGTIPTCTKDLLDKKTSCDYLEIYIDVQKQNIKSNMDADLDVFSDTDIQVLDLITSHFGNKNSTELSEYSHKFPEWKRYENKINNENEKSSYQVITDDFFENVEEESGIFNDDDELLQLTKKIFNQIK